MAVIPISLAGATGGHRSQQFGGGLTKNMYLDEAEGRTGAFDFPGCKAFGTQGGEDQGAHVMAGMLYRLAGRQLYSVSFEGVYTSLGTVTGGSRAIFADDGTNLFFTVDGELYQYNGTTLSTVSQSVVSNPDAIAYINRQFIIAGDDGLFATSDVADGSTYNALNFAEAESSPDGLIRPYVFNQLVYMFGERTTELWYNSGSGNPPFARQDTALVNVGIAGRTAVTNTDQHLYWVGDDRKVYQAVGASSRPITDPDWAGGPSVAYNLERLETVNDCVASHFVLEGQTFVLFYFSASDKSFLFSETRGYWVELDWIGSAVAYVYNRNLVTDKNTGNVYELDPETYTDNGATRFRELVLPSLNGSMINHDGRVIVSHLRMNMQVGVGLETGQGSNPQVMCQFSPDGGHTYQAERFVEFGALGDYDKRVDFYDFASGYDVRPRLRCSDPVFWSVFDGFADVQAAGH